jgi:hypothetical protein
LPNAKADISFRGRLHEKQFFVSSLNGNSCSPLESPFDWAGHQPKQFRLDGQRPWDHLNPALTNASLLEGADGWELSDAEWSRIEHLLPPAPH